LDRFLIKISIGYPGKEEEAHILSNRRRRRQDEFSLDQVVEVRDILEMQALIEDVHVHEDIENYIIKVVRLTREDQRVAIGSSPRGSLAFQKIARAYAAIKGRDFVIPDDIKHFDEPVLTHRLILQPAHWMAPRVKGDVIRDIFTKVPVPVL
jgi:MoxR-like ATPase